MCYISNLSLLLFIVKEGQKRTPVCIERRKYIKYYTVHWSSSHLPCYFWSSKDLNLNPCGWKHDDCADGEVPEIVLHYLYLQSSSQRRYHQQVSCMLLTTVTASSVWFLHGRCAPGPPSTRLAGLHYGPYTILNLHSLRNYMARWFDQKCQSSTKTLFKTVVYQFFIR